MIKKLLIPAAMLFCFVAATGMAQRVPPGQQSISDAPVAPALPSLSETDLCRRQLTAVHDQADADQRALFTMSERLKSSQAETAAMEARLATALEWVKTAQAQAPRSENE